MLRYAVCAALAAALVVTNAAAAAEPPPAPPRVVVEPLRAEPDLEWRWARFQTYELVATGALAAGAIATSFIPPSKHSWRGTNAFDEAARDALRSSSPGGQQAARDASDVLLAVNMAYPFLVDALAAAYGKHRSPDVAFQMAAIDLEALSLNWFVNTLVARLSSRERPYGRLCPNDRLQQNQDCSTNKRYQSFFSGHVSAAFTSAALVCSHHAHLPLFGGGAPDALACAAAMTAAATTGVLRIAGDQHYLSDVLTGAAVGTASGLVVPWLLHYRGGPIAPHGTIGSASWMLLPTAFGATVIGGF